MLPKLKVPFLCTANSRRRRLAEGMLREQGGAREHLGKLVVHHLAVVCARAERECPKRCREAARQDSWPFADALAVDGPREKRFEAFREARDGIKRRILDWLRDPDLGLVGGRT